MKVEILVGLIAIGVIGAVFIPLAFDPAGVGGLDFIECDEEEILKFLFVNGTLNWECAVDESTITEVQAGTFANENTDFRPHLVRGNNVQDPIINFGNYSIRVMEFLESGEGEVSWDYLVPQDYEVGEDLEFTVYWFKEDGLSDPSEVDVHYEEVTACDTDTTFSTALIVEDTVEYDFVAGQNYMIYVTSSFGGTANNELVGTYVKHGNDKFIGSESIIEPSLAGTIPCNESENLYSYEWFTVYSPTVLQEDDDISVIFENFGGSQSVIYDDVTIGIGNMASMTENIDYFFNINGTSAILDDTSSWATPNDASITFTPTHNGNSTWLVVGTASYCCESDGSNKDFLTRFNFGGSASNYPEVQREAEDSGQLTIESFHRTLELDNSTHTFSINSQLGAGDIANLESRNSTSIFAVKLTDNFSDFDYYWNENDIEIGEVDYGTEIAEVSITATSDDRQAWIIGDFSIEQGRTTEVRVQMDNVDTIPDQTTQSYDFDHEYGSNDRERWQKSSIEPVTNGTHIIEIDVSEGANQPSSFATHRSLTAILLEEPVTNSTGLETACMEVRLMSVDEGEDLSTVVSPTFGDWKKVCATTTGGADILRTFTFPFNSTEIPFEAGDVGMVQLKRDPIDNVDDDYIGKLFALFGELQWVVVP